ncbi:hypothetical protein B1H29_15755 [Streptomyces pactum]|uniref:Uncharacterized protein n=2 Tax=Streptomyces pactum TaxID=68249 RepID=A0A1S6J8Y8_9ACTN|nr:hypothetical protein B1H29_15755 [Streptomyces pactum]
MCARCRRTTDEPVLVHEVHAATGPGFNVYACPECAEHYPPMTDVLELLDSAARRRAHTGGPLTEPIPCSSTNPPCACPRCTARL